MSWTYCLRPVPGLKGYFADRNGGIWSHRLSKVPRRISGAANPSGYILHNLGSRGRKRANRMVLSAFSGECPEGMQCCHINGNRTDNRIENLRWGTPQENHDDKKKHGTTASGSSNCKAKLNEPQVKTIKAMLGTGKWSGSELARMFNVSKSAISRIKRGATWGQVHD